MKIRERTREDEGKEGKEGKGGKDEEKKAVAIRRTKGSHIIHI